MAEVFGAATLSSESEIGADSIVTAGASFAPLGYYPYPLNRLIRTEEMTRVQRAGYMEIQEV